MKIRFMKKQNGFMVTDAMLAILILIMFTGIITSLIYNIVLTTKKIKISSQEIAYITDVLNHANIIRYDEVTTENLISYINTKTDTVNSLSAGTDTSTLVTPYKMSINVQTYEPKDTSIEKRDLIKIITVKVECTLAKKTYSIEMKTLREIKDFELQMLF